MNTTAMTREAILALTGRELDAAVAEQVMGIKEPSYFVPCYSTDANACRLMEAEIERRGVISAYVRELRYLVLKIAWHTNGSSIFKLMSAPLDQKCRAALLSVLNAEENQIAE